MINNSMTQTRFWTVIGIFVVIMTGIFSYVISEIDATGIELDTYQHETFIQIAEIDKKTERIETDVSWIKKTLENNFK